eukprot:15387005-Alexandrium_andersonii.AAC.1
MGAEGSVCCKPWCSRASARARFEPERETLGLTHPPTVTQHTCATLRRALWRVCARKCTNGAGCASHGRQGAALSTTLRAGTARASLARGQ